jgi:hypothetical protein
MIEVQDTASSSEEDRIFCKTRRLGCAHASNSNTIKSKTILRKARLQLNQKLLKQLRQPARYTMLEFFLCLDYLCNYDFSMFFVLDYNNSKSSLWARRMSLCYYLRERKHRNRLFCDLHSCFSLIQIRLHALQVLQHQLSKRCPTLYLFRTLLC